jgi:hypothetical protein
MSLATLVLGALPVVPQVDCNRLNLTCPPGANANTITQNILTIINPPLNSTTWVIVYAFLIGVLFLIYGGARYIMSQGNEEETKRAKQIIIFVIIGFIIIGLAGLIINAILSRTDAGLAPPFL